MHRAGDGNLLFCLRKQSGKVCKMVKGKNYKICLLYKLKLCMEGTGLGIYFERKIHGAKCDAKTKTIQ